MISEKVLSSDTSDLSTGPGLLAAFLDELHRRHACYLVLRNYSGYPARISGDVDFLLPANGQRSLVWETLESLVAESNWHISQIIDRPYVRSYTFINPGPSQRRVLVFDFFLSLSWYTVPYANAEEIISNGRQHGGIRVPAYADEAFICFAHYLLWNSVVPAKYRERIREAITTTPALFRERLTSAFGLAAMQYIEPAIHEERWEAITSCAWRLRLQLIRRNLSWAVGNDTVELLTSMTRKWKRLLPGLRLIWNPQETGATDGLLLSQIIDRLRPLHLYRGFASIPPLQTGVLSGLRRLRVELLLRRGLCVIDRAASAGRRIGRDCPYSVLTLGHCDEAHAVTHLTTPGRNQSTYVLPEDLDDLVEGLVRAAEAQTAGREAARGRTPPPRRGMIVALVGPDGTGKSTALRRLRGMLSKDFARIEVRHWRPGVLPPLSRFARKATARKDTAPPRRQAGRLGAVRLLYYYIDFVLGHLVRDWPIRRKGGLVLYDRCALDMIVDPHRYALRSGRWLRLLWPMMPRPHLVVLLQDRPERIVARKNELSASEVARQLALWAQLHARGVLHARIEVSASAEQTAADVAELIRQRAGLNAAAHN